MSEKQRLDYLVSIVKHDLDVIGVQYATCPIILSNNLRVNQFARTIGFINSGNKHVDRIEIQRKIFEDMPDMFLLSIICHELLHSSPECVETLCGHDYEWHDLADYVNRMYPDKYVITEFADEFIDELKARQENNAVLN